MTTLPIGWSSEALAKLGTWTGGGTPNTGNPAFWTNGTIPWVSPKDMKQRRLAAAQDSITNEALQSSATNLIAENSVMLVTRSGILRHSLPVAINTKPVTMNQDMKALTPLEGVDSDYLYFAFCRFEREILHNCCKGGTTVQSIEAPRLMAFEIPVAPLAEQRRIVAKIEELLSELDKGIENLKQARAQLAVYRQALLKHAFEGKLTAAWRAARGKDSSSWSDAAVSNILIGKPTNGRSVPDRAGGFRVLRLTSIKNGYIDLNQNKEGAWTEAEAADQILHRGDFLISRGNGSLHLVGKGGLVLSDDRVAYPDTMVRMKVNPSVYDQRLFCYFWNSGIFRRQVESSARTTAGIYKINQALIMAYRFPLMPLAEQQAIVEILDAQIPALDIVEADIDINLRKSEALRQAILKKAFTGELVPQDPADEPAAALLARIRAERAAEAAASPKRRAARL